VIELHERIVLLAAALSPKSAASALEGLREKPRVLALERLEQARQMNRLQWRQRLAAALQPERAARESVLAAAGPALARRLREQLAAPTPIATPTTVRERLLKRLVRECGG